jgi:hypothetical protein
MKLSVKQATLTQRELIRKRANKDDRLLPEVINECLPRGWKIAASEAELGEAIAQFGILEALRLLARPAKIVPDLTIIEKLRKKKEWLQ